MTSISETSFPAQTASGDHREASQGGLLFLLEEAKAPVDRGSERLMTRDGDPARAGQEAEPVIQSSSDLVGREGADARRGQLDRQRHTIQTAADLGDRSAVVGRDAERWRCGHRALREE